MQWSHKRCPRSSCPDYHRRLAVEIGQHEIRGELTVEHRCISCGYVEYGPSTPAAAWRTSRLEAIERLRKQRAEGFRVPLKYDGVEVEG
jgi:hypothetical protein